MVVKNSLRSSGKHHHIRPKAQHTDNTNVILGIALGVAICGAALFYGAFHKDSSTAPRNRANAVISAPAPNVPDTPKTVERAEVKAPPAPAPVIAARDSAPAPEPAPKNVIKNDAITINPNAPKPFWMSDDAPVKRPEAPAKKEEAPAKKDDAPAAK